MEIASAAAYLWADVFLLNYNGPPKSNSPGDNAAEESSRARAAAEAAFHCCFISLCIYMNPLTHLWEEEEEEIEVDEAERLRSFKYSESHLCHEKKCHCNLCIVICF